MDISRSILGQFPLAPPFFDLFLSAYHLFSLLFILNKGMDIFPNISPFIDWISDSSYTAMSTVDVMSFIELKEKNSFHLIVPNCLKLCEDVCTGVCLFIIN